MDTQYERLDVETRRDWQGHPVTQAFLRTLEDYRRQLATNMLLICETSTADFADHDLKIAGGERKALLFAIDLAGGAHGY